MSIVDNRRLQERVGASRILAILRGTDIDATVAAARTLLDAGILTLEIALTLDGAEEAIAQVVQDAPAGAMIGAGTVLTRADVDRSVSAGAQFMVTPTLSESVDYAVRQGIGVLPGVYSPTEIQRGLDLGAAAVKLFPASGLGPGFIRAVREPLPHARIIPVGGVTVGTVGELHAAGAFAVGVGGPLLGDAATSAGDLEGLAARAAAYLEAVARS